MTTTEDERLDAAARGSSERGAKVSAGQRWRENDPRFDRVIQVVEVRPDEIIASTVYADGEVAKRRSRIRASRFLKAYTRCADDARSNSGSAKATGAQP